MMKSTLEITTVSSCPNDCYFCPQEAYRKAYKGKSRLSLDDFNTVLKKLPKDLYIVFSGYSEPFLNSDCTSMVESALAQGFQVKIYSTLVGMREEDVRRLAKCNINEFTLHLPDNLNNTKIPVNTQTYKDVLALALQSLKIDEVAIMNKNFTDNERAGLGRTAHGRHLHGMFTCFRLENPQFILLPNCDVTLCCQDFGLRHILGNLLEQSYENILASPEFKKIRANRYKMDGDIICRQCKTAFPLLEYYTYHEAIKILKPTIQKLLNNKYLYAEKVPDAK